MHLCHIIELHRDGCNSCTGEDICEAGVCSFVSGPGVPVPGCNRSSKWLPNRLIFPVFLPG